MDSNTAIYNLECYKKKITVQAGWTRNVGLSSVFDQMIKVADEQISLYKEGKGRLQSNS